MRSRGLSRPDVERLASELRGASAKAGTRAHAATAPADSSASRQFYPPAQSPAGLHELGSSSLGRL